VSFFAIIIMADAVLSAAAKIGHQMQNSVRKKVLDMLYGIEIYSFNELERAINRPVIPMSAEQNAHAQWQYQNQQRVHETPTRFWEYLSAPLAIPTLALGTLIRMFSTTNLIPKEDSADENNADILPDGEEKWTDAEDVQKNWVYQMLRDSPPTDSELEGDAFISFTGLAWFFSTRMGCYYLSPYTDMSNGSTGFVAQFDQLTKYELKPTSCKPRTVAIYFGVKRSSDATKLPYLCVSHLEYNGAKITEESDSNFNLAWQTAMCLALTDGSLRYHGIYTHLLTGDVFTCATVRALPVDHALRPLVQNFTHNVFNTNNLLRHIVLAEDGSIHSLFSFSWKGVQDYQKDIFASYRIWKHHYEPWTQEDAILRRSKYTFAIQAVSILNDSFCMWDAFAKYVREYTHSIGLKENEDVIADEAVADWVHQVALQQPNDDSKHDVESLWKTSPLECVHRLLTIFVFHSTVTHDISALTKSIVATPFAVPTTLHDGQAVNEHIPGKHTSARAMLASYSTNLEVPLLYQKWGDIMLPNCADTMLAAKVILNSLPTRLQMLDKEIRAKNKRRVYVSSGVFPNTLKCSISV
jgi:hypothetical protein